MSLKALYEGLHAGGPEGLKKTAAEVGEGTRKLAGHYYDIGRGMARAQFTDMLKSAMASEEEAAAAAAGGEEEPPGAETEEDELARRKAGSYRDRI